MGTNTEQTLLDHHCSATGLLYRTKSGLQRLRLLEQPATAPPSPSSNANSIDPRQVSYLRNDIATIFSLCSEMDRLRVALSPDAFRAIWARRVESTRAKANSMKEIIERHPLPEAEGIEPLESNVQDHRRISRGELRVMRTERSTVSMMDRVGKAMISVFQAQAEHGERVRELQRQIEHGIYSGRNFDEHFVIGCILLGNLVRRIWRPALYFALGWVVSSMVR